MFGLPRKIVIFDLECTTWQGALARNWSGQGEHRELVQAGAALIETRDFAELSVFQTLVKPRINSLLSDYFVRLTGIAQKEVDEKGVDFAVFLHFFREWCKDYELYFFDRRTDFWFFDRDVLVENCDLYGLEFPFRMEGFCNINEIFLRHGVTVENSGLAPKAFGVTPKLRSHNALNDVRGLVEGLKLLKKKVA